MKWQYANIGEFELFDGPNCYLDVTMEMTYQIEMTVCKNTSAETLFWLS